MSELLTYCTCVDPRRINPATGHYVGCPDEIIPSHCLLPPWEVTTTEERQYAGKGARSERYPDGKPIFEKVQKVELVPGRAWTAPVPVDAPTSPIVPAVAAAAEPVELSDIVCVIDTETTGLRKTGTVCGVCEIALCVVDLSASEPTVIARHAKLLHPGMPIPASATAVHHITDAMVAGASHITDMWPAVVAWVAKHAGENAQLVAHNAPFDREVIADVLRAHSVALPGWHWRCSMSIARKVVPGLPSYSLHDSPGKVGLATSLSLTRGESHRAMGDVITTVSLLGALRARAGAWSSWRGDAVVWGAAKAVEAPRGAEKPVESAPEKPAPVAPLSPTPSPAPAPKTVKGRRPAPTGPDLFSRIAKESA